MKPLARTFAIAAHGNQKYGEHPYVYHLDQVAGCLIEYGEYSELAQTVAYLHDVIEDTPITHKEIAEKFGDLVADCVSLLSDEPGVNRKERKAKTYHKLSLVTGPTELALLVKAADRLANVRACIADQELRLFKIYQDEHPIFRAAAFRPHQCDFLWEQLDKIIIF